MTAWIDWIKNDYISGMVGAASIEGNVIKIILDGLDLYKIELKMHQKIII